VNKKVIANFWVEYVENRGWRIAYKNTDIHLFYFIGNTWTPDAGGAKIYSSSDEATLALTKLMMEVVNA
jgi:hypothetical protein